MGNGGVYQIDELRDRGEMLGLLKAYVNLMTQDLNLFLQRDVGPSDEPDSRGPIVDCQCIEAFQSCDTE